MDLNVTHYSARGDEKKETITLKVIKDCDLIDYMVADATYDSKGNTSNLHRHSYWFKKQAVNAGDTIVLHTRSGKDTIKKTADNTRYDFFWGLGVGIWNDGGDKVILVKVAKLKVAPLPAPAKPAS